MKKGNEIMVVVERKA